MKLKNLIQWKEKLIEEYKILDIPIPKGFKKTIKQIETITADEKRNTEVANRLLGWNNNYLDNFIRVEDFKHLRNTNWDII